MIQKLDRLPFHLIMILILTWSQRNSDPKIQKDLATLHLIKQLLGPILGGDYELDSLPVGIGLKMRCSNW